MNKFGKNVKKYRLQLGMSQEELATRMGYKSKSTINKIESNKNDMPLSKVKQLANILNVSPCVLIMDDDEYETENAKVVPIPIEREEPETIAAHHDNEWTAEELDELEKFKTYVRSKRK